MAGVGESNNAPGSIGGIPCHAHALVVTKCWQCIVYVRACVRACVIHCISDYNSSNRAEESVVGQPGVHLRVAEKRGVVVDTRATERGRFQEKEGKKRPRGRESEGSRNGGEQKVAMQKCNV